jgi:hypothetical protein
MNPLPRQTHHYEISQMRGYLGAEDSDGATPSRFLEIAGEGVPRAVAEQSSKRFVRDVKENLPQDKKCPFEFADEVTH